MVGQIKPTRVGVLSVKLTMLYKNVKWVRYLHTLSYVILDILSFQIE
jgi:hypothetical protein